MLFLLLIAMFCQPDTTMLVACHYLMRKCMVIGMVVNGFSLDKGANKDRKHRGENRRP